MWIPACHETTIQKNLVLATVTQALTNHRHSREGGNPSPGEHLLDPRLRGDEKGNLDECGSPPARG
jgi:hypothetical protein